MVMEQAAKSLGLGSRQIYETLRDQINEGVFGSDGALPSSRALASELVVSRTTVTAAYEQLQAEGFIEVKQGMRPRVIRMGAMPAAKNQNSSVRPPRLSSYGKRMATFATWSTSSQENLVADFRHGDLSGADFPNIAWHRAMSTVTRSRPDRISYSDPRGSQRLRMALQGYLWRARTIRCDLDQIIVVNGSQQGLDLCARLLLDREDRFVIENPCYDMARQVFEFTGAVPDPIDVDENGLKTHLLDKIKAKLAYVTPSHQFPLGGVMPLVRRKQLLDWAIRSDAYIVEDDYDSEFRYDINPVPPLYGLEDNGGVIYCGTVSKTLSPSLRVGYLVVPPELSAAFANAKMLTDRHTPPPQQEALALLIERGIYEAHVRRTRRLYRERREALINVLWRKFGAEIAIEGADAGLHLVVWFKNVPASHGPELLEGARTAGVGIHLVNPLFVARSAGEFHECTGLLIGYSSMQSSQIERGIHMLADIVRGYKAANGSAA